jgi:dUTP pyrophosphatase
MTLQVKFKKMSSNTKLPYKGSLDAACHDVYAHSITFENQKMVIGLGFKTEIPKGYKGVLIPRSNLTKFPWMMNNSMGIIDADYRGEWKMILTPLNGDLLLNALPYGVGDRVGQIYFEQILPVEFIEVEELSDSDRGTGGFGSTGLK